MASHRSSTSFGPNSVPVFVRAGTTERSGNTECVVIPALTLLLYLVDLTRALTPDHMQKIDIKDVDLSGSRAMGGTLHRVEGWRPLGQMTVMEDGIALRL